jgi:UDP-N-acetyl-D-mannosaminuronic acid dehydrogenase
MRTVSIIGLGYIGLPTAALLASRGWRVVGVDTSAAVVAAVNRGSAHIAEPDIDQLVHDAVASGQLTATDEPVEADVTVVCVPTPFLPDTSLPTPDLSYVHAAVRSVAPRLRAGDLLIIESTCPVGTTEDVAASLHSGSLAGSAVRLAYCPERVLPGRILAELVANDRIVGGIDPASSSAAAEFYRTFVEGEILTTDSRTAEMVKLVENSYRDVNIAFANEISVISDRLGIDPWRLIELANHHPRVNILQPGPGVGGHCIAVDPWFIVAEDPEGAQLIRAARMVNDKKTDWVIQQIASAAADLGVQDQPVRVACLGLAYKPNIDDLRESPALRVARGLRAGGIDVLAVEPNLDHHDEFELHSLADALRQADLAVALVAHDQFIGLESGDTPLLDFCGILAHGRGAPRPTASAAPA